MKFRVGFIAHVPDADPEEHRGKVEPSLYELNVRFVKNQKEAIEVCKELAKEKNVLCLGFKHEEVGEISETVGESVGITVARGDGPSNQIAQEAMKEAGYQRAFYY